MMTSVSSTTASLPPRCARLVRSARMVAICAGDHRRKLGAGFVCGSDHADCADRNACAAVDAPPALPPKRAPRPPR